MTRCKITDATRALMAEAWGDDLDTAIEMHEYTARTFDRDADELALAVLARGHRSIKTFRDEMRAVHVRMHAVAQQHNRVN